MPGWDGTGPSYSYPARLSACPWLAGCPGLGMLQRKDDAVNRIRIHNQGIPYGTTRRVPREQKEEEKKVSTQEEIPYYTGSCCTHPSSIVKCRVLGGRKGECVATAGRTSHIYISLSSSLGSLKCPNAQSTRSVSTCTPSFIHMHPYIQGTAYTLLNEQFT